MDFPDKQGRSAEEAAEYWYNAYWDHIFKRSGKFKEFDIQARSLIDAIWTLKDRNRFLEKALAGRIRQTGNTTYIDVEPQVEYDGSIHNGRYK